MGSTSEIDRQIAEKIMGVEILMTAPNGDLVTKHSNNWSPSTSVSHAFEVVDKLKDPGLEGFDFSMMYEWADVKECWVNMEWSVDFWKINESYTGRADTPAMAICLAALETKKQENSNEI